jgi:hypothetical protein
VVVTVLGVLSHLTADLFQCASTSVEAFKNLPHSIVTAFKFVEDMLWWALAVFFVDELHVMHIVIVVGEATQELRDFLFRITVEAKEFGVLLAQKLEFPRDTKEEIAIGYGIVELEFRFVGHCGP